MKDVILRLAHLLSIGIDNKFRLVQVVSPPLEVPPIPVQLFCELLRGLWEGGEKLRTDLKATLIADCIWVWDLGGPPRKPLHEGHLFEVVRLYLLFYILMNGCNNWPQFWSRSRWWWWAGRWWCSARPSSGSPCCSPRLSHPPGVIVTRWIHCWQGKLNAYPHRRMLLFELWSKTTKETFFKCC